MIGSFRVCGTPGAAAPSDDEFAGVAEEPHDASFADTHRTRHPPLEKACSDHRVPAALRSLCLDPASFRLQVRRAVPAEASRSSSLCDSPGRRVRERLEDELGRRQLSGVELHKLVPTVCHGSAIAHSLSMLIIGFPLTEISYPDLP